MRATELKQVSGEELRTALDAREYEAALVELSLNLCSDPNLTNYANKSDS